MSFDPFNVSLDDLRGRDTLKWRQYASDVLPLFVAEMDVEVAEPIRDALTHAVTSGALGYPAGTAYTDSFVSFAERRWGWDTLGRHNVTPVADVITGYVDMICLVTEPGDAVVVSPPVYPPFFSYNKAASRRIVEAPLGEDGRLNFDSLEEAFKQATVGKRPAAYLLCNPHNPTGAAHTVAELTRLAELANKHGVWVVSDEIHAPVFYGEAGFVPYLTVPGSERAFALTSASKAWNLASVPAALAIAGSGAKEQFSRYLQTAHHWPSHFGAISQTVAYNEGEAWLDDMLRGLARNRALLVDLVTEHLPQAKLLYPEATYLAWMDCRDLGIEGDPSKFFIDNAKVALNSGPTFGTGGDGHVRINFATSPAILTEAVQRMAAAL